LHLDLFEQPAGPDLPNTILHPARSSHHPGRIINTTEP